MTNLSKSHRILSNAMIKRFTKDGLSLEMEKTLNEQPGAEESVKAEKILEINPDHPLFKAFTSIQSNDDLVKEYASLLYDEAMLLEGREIENKQEFIKKMILQKLQYLLV